MAVEARHLNLFPPQILYNREKMMNEWEGLNYGGGMMYGGVSAVAPMTGTAPTPAEIMLPIYSAPPMAKNVTLKAESGLTCSNLHVSRKRSREDSDNSINMNQFTSYTSTLQNPNFSAGSNHSSAAQFTFLGEDFSSQIQRQQLEVDNLIAQHNEKMRLEMEERRKRNSRRIMEALEESVMRKLRAKEDEIQTIAKLNWALEERVKSLCVENKIWRDLAQTNEATANILRNNLAQVLAQVQDDTQQRHQNGAAELVEDAQSCCGSNENEIVEVGTLQKKKKKKKNVVESEEGGNNRRLCRSCGKEEACVMLLPCRHLCLCSVCGSSQHICPVCRSIKNCSLHVNLSSS